MGEWQTSLFCRQPRLARALRARTGRAKGTGSSQLRNFIIRAIRVQPRRSDDFSYGFKASTTAKANNTPSKLLPPHTSRGKAKRLHQPGTGANKLENSRRFRTALRVARCCAGPGAWNVGGPPLREQMRQSEIFK